MCWKKFPNLNPLKKDREPKLLAQRFDDDPTVCLSAKRKIQKLPLSVSWQNMTISRTSTTAGTGLLIQVVVNT